MQQGEKLGLNAMESKVSDILTTENMMIFLLIIKNKNQIIFSFHVLFKWLGVLYWKIFQTDGSNFYLE